MNLEKIKDFRLGCTENTALLHLSREELGDALKARKLEKIDNLYYSVPTRGGDNIRSYLGKGEAPLPWKKGVVWALPDYAP